MSEETTLIIEAGRTERHYWLDLWRYRELFYYLTWRDILVRYKQTVIGIAWALLRPLLTMVVFTVVFGTLAKLPSEGVATLTGNKPAASNGKMQKKGLRTQERTFSTDSFAAYESRGGSVCRLLCDQD